MNKYEQGQARLFGAFGPIRSGQVADLAGVDGHEVPVAEHAVHIGAQ